MTDPITVLITGQLRTPERLRESVRTFNLLRGLGLVDRTRVVTWDEDADREAELVHWLRDHDAEVIVLAAPPIRGIGNIWPQTLSLDVGLRDLPHDRRVLKTRADLTLDAGLVARLASTPEILRLERPPGSAQMHVPFKHRVWVPWMEISKPFYLADECFMGSADDLRTLVNYDETYSLLFDIGCGITHVRRFIDPFVRGSLDTGSLETASPDRHAPYPGLLGYLGGFTQVGHFSPERWTLLEALLTNDAYLRALAEYFAIMATCFRVGAPDGAVVFRDWSSGTPQPRPGPLSASYTAESNGLGDDSMTGGHLFAHGECWLHATLTGAHHSSATDHAGNRLRAFAREILPERPAPLPTLPMETLPTEHDLTTIAGNAQQLPLAATGPRVAASPA